VVGLARYLLRWIAASIATLGVPLEQEREDGLLLLQQGPLFVEQRGVLLLQSFEERDDIAGSNTTDCSDHQSRHALAAGDDRSSIHRRCQFR